MLFWRPGIETVTPMTTDRTVERWQRRHDVFVRRLATVATPIQRVGAAWDLLRGALVDPCVDDTRATEIADDIGGQIKTAVDILTREATDSTHHPTKLSP